MRHEHARSSEKSPAHPAGGAIDFEKILEAADLHDALEDDPQAKDLYDAVSGLIDRTEFPDNEENDAVIIRAIAKAVGQMEVKDEDDTVLDAITDELKEEGIPLKETRNDEYL